MPAPFISEVTFDNKSITGPRTAALGPKTLIVGPNEGHKSAIVEAILYYLYGAMPDIMNRRGPVKAKHLIADITATGGLPKISMKVGDTGDLKVLTRPEHPYLEAYTAFSGIADSAQKYLLQYFDTGKDWSEHLDSSLFHQQERTTNIFSTGLISAKEEQKETIDATKKWIKINKGEVEQAEKEIAFTNNHLGNIPEEFLMVHLERAIMKRLIQQVKPEERGEAKEHIRWVIEHLMGTDSKTVMGTEIEKTLSDMHLLLQVQDKRAAIRDTNSLMIKGEQDLINAERRLGLLEIPYKLALQEATALAVDYINTQFEPHDKIAIDSERGLIGVYRNDGQGQQVPHWSMSGSVQARVIAALAAASATEDTLSVVALPDRAWDEGHLVRTMEMLGGFNAQILICNTYKPKKVPKTWTVLEVK